MSAPDPTPENWNKRGREWTLYRSLNGYRWQRCLDAGRYLAVVHSWAGEEGGRFTVTHRPTGYRVPLDALDGYDVFTVLDAARVLDSGIGADWLRDVQTTATRDRCEKLLAEAGL